jgi:glycosyltransferase involved in cell wall biosynthesis
MRWSNGRIVISEVIRGIVRDKHGRESALIPNGVVLPELPSTTDSLAQFDLTPGRYIVLVSRLVPEKRHMDLIEAFSRAGLVDWKLVIVGSSDHPDAYTHQVLETAAKTQGVVCTGFQSGQALRELYAHAGLFVLPSSHEGLPIAMLEALSYGLPVVASNIPANLEVGLPAENYYPLGDVSALSARLSKFAVRSLNAETRESRRAWVSTRFDWRDIARRTMVVYQAVVSGRSD